MSLSPIRGHRLGEPMSLHVTFRSAGVQLESAQAGALKANLSGQGSAPWLRGTGLLGEQVSSVQRLQVTPLKVRQQTAAHSSPFPKCECWKCVYRSPRWVPIAVVGKLRQLALCHMTKKNQNLAYNLGLLAYDGLLSRTLRNGWSLLGQREKGAKVLHTLRTVGPPRAACQWNDVMNGKWPSRFLAWFVGSMWYC